MTGHALRYLSLDLFKTLIFPKENLALTYARFGQTHLKYEFDFRVLMPHFVDVYDDVESKWPNFGAYDGVSSERWWNEVVSI